MKTIKTNGTGYAIVKRAIESKAFNPCSNKRFYVYDITKNGSVVDKNLTYEQARRIFKNYYTDANMVKYFEIL